MPEMSIGEHNGQVASGLQAIAANLGAILDTTTRTQETHDTVIKLESKMDNVEVFMSRITKQLDDLPTKLDACYARKESVEINSARLDAIAEKAADKDRLSAVEYEVGKFKNLLVGLGLAVLLTGALIALGIADKVHFF